MPIHDWTSVDAGIFHAFHLQWIADISGVLNRGLLPPEFYALADQVAGDFAPDVLTLNITPLPVLDAPSGGIALADAPPKADLRIRSQTRRYASRVVAIRHVSNHRIVAMIELVSPGNKSSQAALNAFVHKAQQFIAAGVHLLIIDLFPPSSRDPMGLPAAILEQDSMNGKGLPAGKPLTCASYMAGGEEEAFINFVQVGDPLPQMPLFLTNDIYVLAPLEQTYCSAWEAMPTFWRKRLEAHQRAVSDEQR